MNVTAALRRRSARLDRVLATMIAPAITLAAAAVACGDGAATTTMGAEAGLDAPAADAGGMHHDASTDDESAGDSGTGGDTGKAASDASDSETADAGGADGSADGDASDSGDGAAAGEAGCGAVLGDQFSCPGGAFTCWSSAAQYCQENGIGGSGCTGLPQACMCAETHNCQCLLDQAGPYVCPQYLVPSCMVGAFGVLYLACN